MLMVCRALPILALSWLFIRGPIPFPNPYPVPEPLAANQLTVPDPLPGLLWVDQAVEHSAQAVGEFERWGLV